MELQGDPAATASPDRRAIVRATLIGGVAVLLWASLPLLTTLAGAVPPLLLTALAFGVAFAVAVVKWLASGLDPRRQFAWPLTAWALGLAGLFGYHFCYFMALRYAPAAEATLINHLWPLLIVLFSAALPGERLRWYHLIGAALGLLGVAVLVTDGGRVLFQTRYATGYVLALGCALIWSAYSVLNRSLARDVPSDAVGAFCAGTAVLALIGHLAFESTRWPQGGEWLAVLALGAGPLGSAFLVWDYGCKHGDIRVLGGIAYLAPLLATSLLVVTGFAPASWLLAIACLLIAGGAALASRDMLRRAPA